jgi:mannosyltransferase
MNVIFDNIIFSLQRFGGISVVWNELLQRAQADKELNLTELDYRNERLYRRLERYRIPDYMAEKPSVFHSSYFRVLPQAGVHNVTTVHDLTYHFYRKGLPKAVHLWEEARALKHSEAIICISENTKRDLLTFYPWVKEETIHVIYNGVSDDFYPIKNIEKKGYLLFIGNSSVSYKRYDIAQEVAKRTGLELVTARNVTSEELNKLYNEALCLLYPSDYEGFGLPILEAQKAGCPVIAQNYSSVPEVIGKGGLIVEHSSTEKIVQQMVEKVNEVQSRPMQGIIAAGIENAKRFSWDNTYEQTKNVYRQLLQ